MKLLDKIRKKDTPPGEIDLKRLEEDGALKRTLTGNWDKIFYVFAIAMSLFHIYALILSSTTMWYLYCVHVGMGAVLTFALYSGSKRSPLDRPGAVDIVGMLATAFAFIYMAVEMNTLVYRIGIDPTAMDLVVAVIIIVVVLEITRRTCGNILPLIALIFILYAKFGHLILGPMGHRLYTWQKVLSYQLGMDALFSSSVQASATYVFLFLIFGSFLQASGCGQFFIDFANSVAGASRGGPAKVAVISSALFGTVSGNSVANVVTTGSFTIPLMKSIGYSPKFSGAVEATASTGGQIMPPILGSAAFIMAALIGVPYKDIIVASILPALLYFYTVFIMVDLEAAKTGLKGLPREQLPKLSVVSKKIYLLLPLAVIFVTLTAFNLSPIRAAAWGIISAIAVTFVNWKDHMTFKGVLDALASGAKSSCSLVASTATAGLVVGVLNMTGAGLKLAGAIVSLAQGHLFPALLLTMITCVIMGMGLPTTASYLICVSVAAPALIELGVPVLSAHMFVFYFACISAITPPVALAAYAGAGIAKAKPIEVAFTSCKLGISAFIVPFMFAYAPSLIMQGTLGEIALTSVTALLGVTAISFGLQRQISKYALTIFESALLVAAAFLLIKPGIVTDYIGIGLAVTGIIMMVVRLSLHKKKPEQSE